MQKRASCIPVYLFIFFLSYFKNKIVSWMGCDDDFIKILLEDFSYLGIYMYDYHQKDIIK